MRDEKVLKIAFLFQVPSFWNTWDSLYRACHEDDNCEISFFLIEGSDEENAQMAGAESFLRKKYIDYELYSYEKVIAFNPDYIVFQTPYDNGHRPIEAWSIRFKLAGIKIIYIPYGIEISDTHESRYKHFALATVLNAFAIYTMSEAIKKEYEKYCINFNAVRSIGHPRFDAYSGSIDLEGDLKKRIAGRKIVLWKVHFPKVFVENGLRKTATPDMVEYLNFIKYIEKNEELFFIFMPHPKFADKTIDEELRERAQCILDELSILDNVYIDVNSDYHPSFMNADAIIVDRSALMVEAAAMNVPVLYMHNEEYDEPMIEPIGQLLDAYENGTKAKAMIDFCENIKNGIDIKKLERNLVSKTIIPPVDGKNGERIKFDLFKHKDDTINPRNVKKCDFHPIRIVIWGCGELGDICLKCIDNSNLFRLVCMVDKNYIKAFEKYNGKIEIISPSKLVKKEFDYIVIATDKYFIEVYDQIITENIVNVDHIINYDEFVVLCKF